MAKSSSNRKVEIDRDEKWDMEGVENKPVYLDESIERYSGIKWFSKELFHPPTHPYIHLPAHLLMDKGVDGTMFVYEWILHLPGLNRIVSGRHVVAQ